MPRLTSPRDEKFCQGIAAGKTGAAAYRAACGHNPIGAKQMAFELLQRPEINARIEELREASESKHILTMQERRKFLARNVRVDLTKFDPLQDGDLVQEIDYHPDGKVKKYKLPGKRECVMDDAKLAGDLTERTETVHLGDPSAPLIVSLPVIITTPRPRKQPQQPA